MKIIVAGTRDLDKHIQPYSIQDAISRCVFELVGNKAPTIIEGGAKGVDSLARQWAAKVGHPLVTVEADWDEHGNAAGPIRNRQMAEMADALVLVWDGKSPGSSSMLSEARRSGLKIIQVVYHRTVQREGF